MSSTRWPGIRQQGANPEAGRWPGCWLVLKFRPQGQVPLASGRAAFIFSGDLLEYISTPLEQTLKIVSGKLLILEQWQNRHPRGLMSVFLLRRCY